MAIQTYSGPDLRWFAALIGLMLLRQYLNLSPLLVLLLLLLGVCLCSGRSPASSESFSPVHRPLRQTGHSARPRARAAPSQCAQSTAPSSITTREAATLESISAKSAS